MAGCSKVFGVSRVCWEAVDDHVSSHCSSEVLLAERRKRGEIRHFPWVDFRPGVMSCTSCRQWMSGSHGRELALHCTDSPSARCWWSNASTAQALSWALQTQPALPRKLLGWRTMVFLLTLRRLKCQLDHFISFWFCFFLPTNYTKWYFLCISFPYSFLQPSCLFHYGSIWGEILPSALLGFPPLS